MKTILIESVIALAELFIIFRSLFYFLASKVEAPHREKSFYLLAGFCSLSFALAAIFVFPQLSIVLNYYEKSNDWVAPIQYGGAYLLLILVTGFIAVILSFLIFKITTREKSVWELIRSDNIKALFFLCGILVSSGIVLGVLAGEIAKLMIPYAPVPFNY